MGYSVRGTFYEACDCEVICSCWGGVDPDGGCTGLYAWQINEGNVNGIDVANTLIVAIFYGKGCDDASQLRLIIDANGGSQETYGALFSAVGQAPWLTVLNSTAAMNSLQWNATPGSITITPAGTQVSIIAIVAGQIEAEANCEFSGGITLHGGTLVTNATGSEKPLVTVGKVITAPGSNNGLNIWSHINNSGAGDYTFDLDITRVSAVSSTFTYVAP